MTEPAEPAPDENNLSEEKVRPLVEELENEARKIGLYLDGVALSSESDLEADPQSPLTHKLIVQFKVGKDAFAAKVQDPEQAKVDYELKKMESGDLKDTIDNIRSRYKQGGKGES